MRVPSHLSRPRPNPSGVHFLSDRSVVAGLVRAADVGPGDLVVELGAGPGVLTAPLAGTGARVLAVERDAAFVRRLERRFGAVPEVRVVAADLRTVPLPRRGYSVVANLPFAVTTVALRRLLDPADTPLLGAELIVEWGLARRLTAAVPRDAETAWWAARFALRLSRRVPATSFRPAPRVAAAHLSIRPTGLPRPASRLLRALLTTAYARPDRSVSAVLATVLPKRRAHRLALSTGLAPPTPAGQITPATWARLATDAATT